MAQSQMGEGGLNVQMESDRESDSVSALEVSLLITEKKNKKKFCYMTTLAGVSTTMKG